MILIPLFYFYFISLFCVKVPYSVKKIHTVKYLKNFNVNEIFTPRKFHEILHLYSSAAFLQYHVL